ncbi:hypothetical protein ACS0TY_035238 [Phlomoides rotata]
MVTYVGAREQIKRRLEVKGLIDDDRLLFSASCYAANVTLAALDELFQAARGIMGWLGDCAKVCFRALFSFSLKVKINCKYDSHFLLRGLLGVINLDPDNMSRSLDAC